MKNKLLFFILSFYLITPTKGQEILQIPLYSSLDPVAEALNYQGFQLLEDGRYPLAKAYFWEAIQIDSTNIDYFYNLGMACLQDKDYAFALKAYRIAKNSFPDFPDLYFYSGDLLQKMERYEEAILEYNKAIALAADEPNPQLHYLFFFNRGNAYFKSKNFKAAIQDYNQTISISPEYYGAYANRGYANYHIKNYKSACNDWEIAASLGYPKAIYYLQKYCNKQ
ncbi:tetratricopeptide repeat protein [Algivirga pacifica]|uniref:Tetratricopeptide repeat-containing protein n=1 Tax=Algivirga pacifica TaxID=1162670 RepID=A0ABP9D9Y2_9BACT